MVTDNEDGVDDNVQHVMSSGNLQLPRIDYPSEIQQYCIATENLTMERNFPVTILCDPVLLEAKDYLQRS